MGFSKEKINEVLNAVDIVELVSRDIELVKKGGNYFGICPFHHESTTSFSVNASKRLAKCFGCGAGGDAIAYMIAKGYSFTEAVEYLAKEYGVEIKKESKQDSLKKEYYKLNNHVKKFYSIALHRATLSEEGRTYLKQRKINTEIAKYFELGSTVNDNDLLHKTMEDICNREKLDINKLEVLNIIKNKKDIFKDRIIIPIHDKNGNCIGFNGRTFNEQEKVKYLLSKFTKKDILYNFYKARENAKKKDNIYLFEGCFDVISAYKIGIDNGVAILGSSLNETHINQIKPLTKNVILAFDTDKAGLLATEKAILLLNKHDIDIQVIIFEKDSDVDEQVAKGKKEFKQIDHYEWVKRYYKRDIDITKINGKKVYKERISKYLNSFKDNFKKEIYLQDIANELGVDKKILEG